jgi:hypothetical protein
MTFKIKVYVALGTETSGRVMHQCNRMLKYNIVRVDSWSNEAADIVGNHHQATTGEDTAG